MMTLHPSHVLAWRMQQHFLNQRASEAQMLDVVRQIGGLQAQLSSAAELMLWARAHNLQPEAVDDALWRDRKLVKTWAQRGTLHLLAAADLPLYVAARSVNAPRRPPSYYAYHKVTPDELQAIEEGVRATLSATPMTREQLADAITERSQNPKLREVLLSGWGALLKPSAFAGDICYGPNQGQNVTFVRPNQWLHTWEAFEPQVALAEVVRRYLTAYGPATSDDFARWWGIEPAKAKPIFRSLAPELVAVDVGGWKAQALRTTVDQMQASAAVPTVRLLPNFDPYTIALYRQPFVLAEAYKSLVSRPQGWISPVVLVAGQIVGIWEQREERAKIVVEVAMFDSPSPQVKQDIAAEVARLGAFVGTEVEVV